MMVSSTVKGAVAGAAAAGGWLIAQPAIRTVTGSAFDDARLLGRLIRPNGPWRLIGTTAHLVNGAMFGAVYARFSPRHSALAGVAAAQSENALLWPAFFVVDRIHPDRRNGNWPPLPTSKRVIAHEVIAHLLFGAALGAMERRLNGHSNRSR